MVIDMTNPVHRIRVGVADWEDLPILPDDVYEYLLTKYDNNETACIREAAYMILGTLSRQGRVRVDRIELFGESAFTQYMQYIKAVIKNPGGSHAPLGGVYSIGVSAEDIIYNLESQRTEDETWVS